MHAYSQLPCSRFSVELVRSLFCGLPDKDSRVAVVLAASDETYSKDRFVYGGLLAPVNYWERIFAPRWERDVLHGNPPIPYLHMTAIRSRQWREEIGISESEADLRVENAIEILCKRNEPAWIGFEFGHGHFNDTLRHRIQVRSGASKKFVPEYLGFMGYVLCVLREVKRIFPGARKVDFLVERNGEITKHLSEFYENVEPSLRELGADDDISLLGDIIPGGKDRSPLQAADVLCWHLRRAREQSLDGVDLQRYKRLEKKKNILGSVTNESMTELMDNLKATAKARALSR